VTDFAGDQVKSAAREYLIALFDAEQSEFTIYKQVSSEK
jgi:hypothetical protein